jgi:hypothetical protein
MAPAEGNVALVPADLDLDAFSFRTAAGTDADDHGGLAPAVTDRLELGELVGEREQTRAPFEQLAAEIGPQPVAQNRYRKLVDDHGEIFHLLAGEELRFVE